MNNGDWEFRPPTFLVGVVSNTSVTTSLCFGGLVGLDPDIRFQFIDPYTRDWQLMDNCDVVIFVRHIFMPAYKDALEQAKQRRKPTYLLVDDNFVALAGEKQPNPIDNEIFKSYAQPIFREKLQEMDGILSASLALTEFFQSYHHVIFPFGAISDHRIKPLRSAPTDDLRVGFFGGGFRAEAFRIHVLPELKELAAKRPVTVVAGPSVEKFRDEIDRSGIELVTVPVLGDFRHFIAKWQSLKIQVAVHPKGETINIKYKTPNAILVSHYLGAVPIVWDEPAYVGIDESSGTLKVGDKDFRTLLASVETAPQREALLVKVAHFSDSTFSPATNISTIRELRGRLWPALYGGWKPVQRMPTIGEAR